MPWLPGAGRIDVPLCDSGDLFLAFSTANDLPADPERLLQLRMLPQQHMNELFVAGIEAVEEAILNSLTMATTTRGQKGRVAYELPLEGLLEAMARYGRAGR